jgi:hypothetical protein
VPVTKIRDAQAIQSIDLTSEVINQLPVANGGTGAATLTGLVKGNGTGAFTPAIVGTDYGSPDATFNAAVATFTNKTIDGANNTVPNVTGSLRPVRVLADSGLTYTISAGTVTQIAGTTIDGVTTAVGDRIAIIGAPASTGAGVSGSTQPGNGIYVVTNATTNTTVSRVPEMSGSAVPWGLSFFVREGTGNANYTFYWMTATGAFTWGTTALAYSGFARFQDQALDKVADLNHAQTFTNKTINGASNTITNVTGELQPARVGLPSTGHNVTISGGTITQITGTTVNGISVAIGDRIVVTTSPASTGATSPATNNPGNGVYVVTAVAANISVARTDDFSGNVLPWGKSLKVNEGSYWGGYTLYWLAGNGAFTWGTTALFYTSFIKWTNQFIDGIADVIATQTLTNKRITPRLDPKVNVTSWTINSDTTDFAENTGLTGAVTINNPTGTPTQGQRLWLTLTGTASRAISYGTAFEDSTVVRPTTTSGTAALDIGFRWNSVTSKWRCVAYA